MKGASLPNKKGREREREREATKLRRESFSSDILSQSYKKKQTSTVSEAVRQNPESSMGGSTSKQERSSGRWVNGSSRGRRMRSTRGENGDREVMVLAMKEAETEWRRERKRLKEEVMWLRKKVEEKEEVKAKHKEWEWVVEQMCAERAVRDEAVERWKKLYLAIKNELDDLIQRTYGEGLHRRPEEEGAKTIQELEQELKVREETIDRLKERIALMEKQQYGKEREIDILRQSLRIISSDSNNKKKKASSPASRNLPIFKRHMC